jgi:hypothetical protein
MGKREISISEAVKDIREGLDDAALMEKYRLAARGLHSLFSKLVSIGQITQEDLDRRMPGFTGAAVISASVRRPGVRNPPTVKARDAVRNIRLGMTDAELMKTYRLTAPGLQDLFEQLLKAGAIKQYELDQRMPSLDKTVDLRGLLEGLDLTELDIGSDAPPAAPVPPKEAPAWEEPPFDDVTPPGPRHENRTTPPLPAPEPPKEKSVRVRKTIKLADMIGDIRLGLSDADLMAKYEMPQAELQRAFQQLLESGAVTRGEIYGRYSLHLQTSAISLDELHQDDPGRYLAFPVPIYEASKPEVVGRVRSLTEEDLDTIGLEVAEGDTKLLMVSPEKFVNIQPFPFEAICRGVKKQPEGTYAAFKITDISKENQEHLRRLISMLTLGG